MKALLYICLTVFMMGCATSGEPPTSEPGNPLQEHVNRFDLHYFGPWPANLDIGFEDISECSEGACVIGYCKRWEALGIRYHEIAIDIISWNNFSEIRKEALMFHELGHCVMYRDHTSQEAMSFMRPVIEISDFYFENRNALYVELFGIGPIDGMKAMNVGAKLNEKPVSMKGDQINGRK